jgi:glutamine amidotransferase
MKKSVAIIRYGMGNVDSVKRAVEECGGSAAITDDPAVIRSATHIILPGVGNFREGMTNLTKRDLVPLLAAEVMDEKKPFLGICLGMHFLAEKGWEGGEVAGLGWIGGEVKRLVPDSRDTRIPHIGWNNVILHYEHPLFAGIPSGKDFYFVHSYHLTGCPAADVGSYTPYCGCFVSSVCHGNICGVQFHPEKSQKAGFQLLRNFLAMGD